MLHVAYANPSWQHVKQIVQHVDSFLSGVKDRATAEHYFALTLSHAPNNWQCLYAFSTALEQAQEKR